MEAEESPKPELKLAHPNPKTIEEFKKIYEEKFNVELTADEALETATAYLQMFQLLTYDFDADDHVS